MKKLYHEFFHVPARGTGTVREKVLIARVTVTSLLMVMCLIVMSLSAYAYFSASVTSGISTLTSARYELEVTVRDSNGQIVSPQDDGVYLLSGGDYEVALRRAQTQDLAEIGYCRILVPNAAEPVQQELFTVGIGEIKLPDGTVQSLEPMTLTLSLPQQLSGAVSVSFVAEWGTCSSAVRLQNGDAVQLTFAQQLLLPQQQPQDHQQSQDPQQEQSDEQPQADASEQPVQSQAQ